MASGDLLPGTTSGDYRLGRCYVLRLAFRLISSTRTLGVAGATDGGTDEGIWKDAQTLSLLKALDKHGEDWDKVADAVGRSVVRDKFA